MSEVVDNVKAATDSLVTNVNELLLRTEEISDEDQETLALVTAALSTLDSVVKTRLEN